MSDEDVIRRRLLVDGDGTGDDRRLNVLLKTMLKWCNASDGPEESQSTHDKMLAQLAQCEFAVIKSQLTAQMTASELKSYEIMSNQIEAGIENAKKHIEISKQDLKIAKTIRKNRMQYDALAKIINEQPDRKLTEEKLSVLKKEIEELNVQRKNILESLELRKKQFYVFLSSIHQLKMMLEASENEEVMNISLDGLEDNIDLDKYDTDEMEFEPVAVDGANDSVKE